MVHEVLFVAGGAALGAVLFLAGSWLLKAWKGWSSLAPRPKHITGEPDSLDFDSIKPLRPDYDWRTQPQTPYRPWHAGPYHVTMGLKQTDLGNWIELDNTYLDKYKLKKSLYENNRNDVLRYLPGCEDALFEALEILCQTLIRRFPTMFRMPSSHTIKNLVTGDIWDISPIADTWEKHHPLEVMGLLATEDFFILVNGPDGQTRLRAAGVCFPAGFKIEERMGQTLWEIHAGKVPQYEIKLAKSMDRFFNKLKVGGAICRFNYAIDDSDELFHRHSHHNLTPEQLGKTLHLEDLHVRVEKQVLQRLPRTRALLFTIRTYVTPLTEVTQDAEVAKALRGSVDGFSEDVAKYKNRSLWNDTFQRHVRAVLGESEHSENA